MNLCHKSLIIYIQDQNSNDNQISFNLNNTNIGSVYNQPSSAVNNCQMTYTTLNTPISSTSSSQSCINDTNDFMFNPSATSIQSLFDSFKTTTPTNSSHENNIDSKVTTHNTNIAFNGSNVELNQLNINDYSDNTCNHHPVNNTSSKLIQNNDIFKNESNSLQNNFNNSNSNDNLYSNFDEIFQ